MENRELPVNRVTATARIGRDLYLDTMSDGLWILDLTNLTVGETLSDNHESSVLLIVKAYPNPSTSVIHLEIPRRTVSLSGAPDDPVCLQIRNLMGQMVLSKIIDRNHLSDIRLVWNGRNQRGESLPSGICLDQIKAGEWTISGRLTYLKDGFVKRLILRPWIRFKNRRKSKEGIFCRQYIYALFCFYDGKCCFNSSINQLGGRIENLSDLVFRLQQFVPRFDQTPLLPNPQG
ncbi:MAG: hypothetical protein KBA26_08530 [Candidatus Delongbacteria bacterium]|nr:hypothetical protein [Candidatus Delongbacteria bacterium]